MPNGFDLGSFLGGVGDFFGGLVADIEAALLFIFQLLQAIAIFLYTLLLQVVTFLLSGFRILLRGLVHVISDIVHGRFLHLWQDYQALKAKLAHLFGPIIRIIQRIRQLYDEWFRRTILPVLNMLQHIRQVLAIFRIFHLKFAQELDDAVLRLEGKIIRNTLGVVREINRIASLLELLSDPRLAASAFPAIGSIISGLNTFFDGIRGILTQLGINSSAPTSTAAGAPATLRQGMDRWTTQVFTNTGDAATVNDQWPRLFADLKSASGG